MTMTDATDSESDSDLQPGLTRAQRRALEVARGIAARGETVTPANIAAEMGVTQGAVNFHRKALRAVGLWPWEDARRGRPRTSGPQLTRHAPREAPAEPIVERADDGQAAGSGPETALDPFALAGDIAALAIELAAILRSWPIASRRRLCDLALRLLEGSTP